MHFIRRKKKILVILGILVISLSTFLILAQEKTAVCSSFVKTLNLNASKLMARFTGKKEEAAVLPPLVKALTLTASNKVSKYVYSGEVKPRYENQLAFQVGGKIVKKNVEVGDTVQQGAILMELDSRDIEQTVKNYAAAVSSAESKYKLASDNLKRYEQLYQNNIIAQAEYNTYVNSYETAKAALEQAQALYAQSSNQLGYCKLYADKTGVISSINAEEGQVVSVGQKVVTLVQNEELEVEINVPENRIDEIKKSQEIEISFWALPDLTVKGTLREISPVADAASRTYRVRISLVDPSPSIEMGMSASVAEKESSAEGLWIPLAAVYQEGEEPAVWIVSGNTVSLKKITLGEANGDQVAVSSGLEKGDVIVTAGVTRLSEGEKIRTGSDNP